MCEDKHYLCAYTGHKSQAQGDFINMDIGSVGDVSDSHNMDSDDLVPSLQVPGLTWATYL